MEFQFHRIPIPKEFSQEGRGTFYEVIGHFLVDRFIKHIITSITPTIMKIK